MFSHIQAPVIEQLQHEELLSVSCDKWCQAAPPLSSFFSLSTLALFSSVINLHCSLSSPSFKFCQQRGSSLWRKWFVSNFAFRISSKLSFKMWNVISKNTRRSLSVSHWNFWIAWKWLWSWCVFIINHFPGKRIKSGKAFDSYVCWINLMKGWLRFIECKMHAQKVGHTICFCCSPYLLSQVRLWFIWLSPCSPLPLVSSPSCFPLPLLILCLLSLSLSPGVHIS